MITTAHAQDLDLVKGLKQGDRKSIDQVYEKCFNQVRVMIVNHSGTSDDAHDVFQDAMMALYQRLHQDDFNLTCKLSSYIQIMCRNIWRSQSRNRIVDSQSSVPEVVDLDAFTVQNLEASDRRNLMYKHFETLSEDCRTILELFFSKVPMAKIAERVGSSEGYIKKRKFVCKSRLIERIKLDPVYKEMMHD